MDTLNISLLVFKNVGLYFEMESSISIVLEGYSVSCILFGSCTVLGSSCDMRGSW